MDRLRRAAILTRLISELRKHGSWCGETHVQRAAYLVQGLFGVELELKFILYHHAPHSFDLTDELTSLRADRLVALQVQHPSCDPRLCPTDAAERLQGLFPKTLDRYQGPITFVAAELASGGVAQLERLATALYVTLADPDASVEERAGQLVRLKPHIVDDLAVEAVRRIDRIRSEAMVVTS